uniref:2-oxoadipate dioxygenase/decarboxylase n=1 Tax=Calcidiscus leptoporus TaxID=127549 RepID=A0A7S0NQK1_9EUKA|mmetsp:Transcript_14373/g.32818  ORF Transcript_14373/g.32818 Transcript_14373/m.32818 type:complete len:332 (+) Transcript_14373:76-1071(+)
MLRREPTQALRALLAAPPLTPAQRFVNNPTPAHSAPLFNELRTSFLTSYLERTPSCERAVCLLSQADARVHNDHVAFRSFEDSRGRSGLAFLQRLFLHFGYRSEERILIPAMPVNATWLEPPEETDWPKIFLSELRVRELPAAAAATIFGYIDGYYESALVDAAIAADDPAALATTLEKPPWSVSSADEETLRELGAEQPGLAAATEYAAWTLSHGHRINHATILLNTLGLPAVDSLSTLNAMLRREGFVFNAAGGADGFTQGSLAVSLEQSSTIADEVQKEFACGTTRSVRCSFLELIHRHDGFRGFLGQNAQGIFSSTWAQRKSPAEPG